MRRRPARLVAVVAVAGSASWWAATPAARADNIDKIGGKLLGYEAEVQQIGASVAKTRTLGDRSGDRSERRLINAKVSFGIGDYDSAALMLYDLVEQGPASRWYDEALYYLGESLFQKRDYVGARTYFTKLIDEVGGQSEYYQNALERLVELSVKLDDDTDVQRILDALDRVPAGKRRDSVPYVRGRYLYFRGDYAGALAAFDSVPPESEYYARARYFAGAALVADGKLGEAAKVYEELLRREARTDADRRVAELSHMALGRIFYERDQASKAIDHYVRISRKSDLFDEALYEVAWVYVNNQEYDKALRALELLALANPESAMAPDVRILEGNLRIRKARRIADAGDGNALEEFNHAMAVFEQTRDTFSEARDAIDRIIAEHKDPRAFVHQITGRAAETFDVEARLPQVAVEWLRQERDVSRVIDVDADLVTIRRDIEEGERIIARLERALNSPSRINVFPELAERRAKLTEIYEAIQALRTDLAKQEGDLAAKYATAAERGEYEALHRRRVAIAREIAAIPGATDSFRERVTKARARYAALATRAQEISVTISATEATLRAVEKFLNDAGAGAGDAAQRAEYAKTAAALRDEIASLRAELQRVRDDITLASDQAGISDPDARRAAELRRAHRQALDAEHRFLAPIAARATGADRTRADQIANLLAKSGTVLDQIDDVNATIDRTVDGELGEVRRGLAEEKRRLAAYRDELRRYESDAQRVGGDMLSEHFGAMSKRFYDVLIRADVGVVDVAWATREQAEKLLKRLTLEESRERRVLQEQFGDVARKPPPDVKGFEDDAAGADAPAGGAQ